MWPWQRNGEQPNHNYLLIRRLVCLTLVGHLCFLLFLFVFYHDASKVSRDVIEVLLDQEITVVRVPFSKVVNKTVPVVGVKAQTQPAAAPIVPVQKEEPAPTILAKPKTSAVKAAKKVKPKPKPKPKPKKEVKKPEPPKVPKVEPKKVETKKPEPQKIDIPQPAIEQNVAPLQDAAQEMPVGENVIYVGQHEFEALEVQRQIQQEAQRCWKAPAGVARDVACQIIVRVGHDGAIQDINIAKKSGILMYDVQARQAVSHMEFPRGSWGKEVVVYFKQS